MRKSSSETRFGLDELVDLGEPLEKLECTQNLRSMFHRVPSLGKIRLESINKLSKNQTKYFGYLLITIFLIVIGSLFGRVIYKRNREAKHMSLANEVAMLADPSSLSPPALIPGKLSIVEALQAKDLGAFDIQLLSLRKYFKLSDLSVFLIVVGPEDIEQVREHLNSANQRHGNVFPFHIVEATSIVPELYFLTKHSEAEAAPYYSKHKFGYITRMIVKLGAAEWVPTEFYIALDADVLCVRPTSFKSLISEGRSAVNIGSVTAENAYQWKGAEQLLDAPGSLIEDTTFGGVPSIYHRMGVFKLKTYLEVVYQQPWKYSLLRYLFGWSDSSLYYSFLKMAGIFEKFHRTEPEGVFRTTGVAAEGTIGTKGWEKWDFAKALSPDAKGYFVHLHGLIGANVAEINERIRPVFEQTSSKRSDGSFKFE